jgi:transcriptional regulator with XRE-family HTH domain
MGKLIDLKAKFGPKHPAVFGGISIHEIARRSGYSPAHICKINSGDRFPSFRAARKIADACGLTLEELWEEIEARRRAA